jgi:predicted Zn-dependent protease
VYLGDGGRAGSALEHLVDASKTVPDQDAREVAAVMAKELEGLQRLGRGDRAGALAALAEAASSESKRPRPNARPYPVKPAGELYAEILLATGNAPAAITQFHTALARTPRRAASLIGLARAEEVAGNRAEAAKAAREFLQIWHLADADRAELKDAKRIASTSG